MHLDNYLSSTAVALRSIRPANLYALLGALEGARQSGATVFTCGNGGSAANASHFAQDLSKGALVQGKPALRAVSLCDNVSALTAWANDGGYKGVFSEQLRPLGRPGDILIAISGSGNSENVLNAIYTAHALEMRTWGITGFYGGKLLSLAHRCVHVKSDDMGIVESAHDTLFHFLVHALVEGLSIKDDTNSAGAWAPPSEAWCPGVEQ